MLPREVRRDILKAMSAQGVAFLLSAYTVLVIPKYIGVESYGYVQLFIFYTSYVSFVQLGLSEGLYLRYGGSRFEQMVNGTISGQLRLVCGAVGFLSVVFGVWSWLTVTDLTRRTVLACFSVYMVLFSGVYFFSHLFQAVNRIGNHAASVALERGVSLILTIGLVLQGVQSGIPYILALVLGKSLSLVYLLAAGRSLLLTKPAPGGEVFLDARRNVSAGIRLAVANSAGLFVVGAARASIDSRFGIYGFGQASLALSLTNFVLLFVSQVGLVLFPALRRQSDVQVRRFYARARDGLLLLLPVVLVLYVPLSYLIRFWLPEYGPAVRYLSIVLPVCYFDGKTNLLFNTVMKVYRRESALMWINLSAVGLSALASFLLVANSGGIEAVLVGALFSVMARNVALELYVGYMLGQRRVGSMCVEVGLSLAFVGAWLLADGASSIIISLAGCLLFVLFTRKSWWGALSRSEPQDG